MKKLIFSILILSSLFLKAQTAERDFSMANKWYKNGNYSKAIELYLGIEKQGLASDDLYFNLGNCYYKLNKVAPTIFYYEKALKMNPMHEDAAFNLTFAKRMTIDVIEELPKTFLQRFSENVIQKLTYDSWALFAVIASFSATILFLLYHFSFSSKKKLFYFNTSIFAVFVLVICVVFAFQNYTTVKNNRTAIVFKTASEIKNAPSSNSDTAFKLHEGTKVRVLDQLDNWRKIKIADGKVGWINEGDLKEI